jgi:hypothetical protein
METPVVVVSFQLSVFSGRGQLFDEPAIVELEIPARHLNVVLDFIANG